MWLNVASIPRPVHSAEGPTLRRLGRRAAIFGFRLWTRRVRPACLERLSWVLLSLLSALFLGIYDLLKKHAVHDNAVLPVLFFSSLAGALVWLALLGVQAGAPGWLPHTLEVAPLDLRGHLMLFGKSALVSASWICSYAALKHLPVSLAAPIRATGPIWTLAGALALLGERPAALEYVGVAVTLLSFYGLSVAGRKDGIHFHRDKWVGWMLAGTLLGAASGLYDKVLLGRSGFKAATVQAWFSIYLAVIFLPLLIGWWRRWWPRNAFVWRWSIPAVGLVLLAADFVYFTALENPEALVALVSSLRRGSTLVAFAGGLLFFGEKNGRAKVPAVLGILAGIIITSLG